MIICFIGGVMIGVGIVGSIVMWWILANEDQDEGKE